MIHRRRTTRSNTNARRPRRPQGRRRLAQAGLTLPELILSVAGIGLIAIGISSMLTAVAYGTASSRDIRTMVVKNKALTNRIGAAVRGSKQVLDTTDGVIVLWTADTNEDGLPNVGELRLIEIADDDTLSSYAADWDGMTDDAVTDANDSYGLGTDFVDLMDTLREQDYFVQTPWASDIDGFTLSFDTGDEQNARVVGFTLTYTIGDLSDTAIGTASLRND